MTSTEIKPHDIQIFLYLLYDKIFFINFGSMCSFLTGNTNVCLRVVCIILLLENLFKCGSVKTANSVLILKIKVCVLSVITKKLPFYQITSTCWHWIQSRCTVKDSFFLSKKELHSLLPMKIENL